MVNPRPTPRAGGTPNVKPKPQSGSQAGIRRYDTRTLVTPDGRRVDPRTLSTERVRVLPAPKRR